VGLRAGLDNIEKRRFFALPGLELRLLSRPESSQSLYRLRYHDFYMWHIWTWYLWFLLESPQGVKAFPFWFTAHRVCSRVSAPDPQATRVTRRTKRWREITTCFLIVHICTHMYILSLGLENREYCRRDHLCWPRNTLYPQKLALTSYTSGGRSVSIVRSRTKATEFVSLFYSVVTPVLIYILGNLL
jgi:hypothetical protein